MTERRRQPKPASVLIYRPGKAITRYRWKSFRDGTRSSDFLSARASAPRETMEIRTLPVPKRNPYVIALCEVIAHPAHPLNRVHRFNRINATHVFQQIYHRGQHQLSSNLHIVLIVAIWSCPLMLLMLFHGIPLLILLFNEFVQNSADVSAQAKGAF